MSAEGRFSRQEALFGADGQRLLARTSAAVIGAGGLGSFVAMELAHSGVGELALIDHDHVETSNLNRLVGALPADAEHRRQKTRVAARMIAAISPETRILTIDAAFDEQAARSSLHGVNVIFACVDSDSVRLSIAAVCCREAIPYFDLASDTGEAHGESWYGGRVLFSGDGERCPSCMDLLDQHELARHALSEAQCDEDTRIYGVGRDELLSSGPSVISINGVVASLAVSEFLKWRTGLGRPAGLLTYRGDLGVVLRAAEDHPGECFYCSSWGSTRPSPSAVG